MSYIEKMVLWNDAISVICYYSKPITLLNTWASLSKKKKITLTNNGAEMGDRRQLGEEGWNWIDLIEGDEATDAPVNESNSHVFHADLQYFGAQQFFIQVATAS